MPSDAPDPITVTLQRILDAVEDLRAELLAHRESAMTVIDKLDLILLRLEDG